MSANPFSGSLRPISPLTAVPPTRELAFAWASYALSVLGLFLLWPALLAVTISLLRRSNVRDTFVASHHLWLVRTFGFAALGYLLSIALVFVGAWDVIMAANRSKTNGGTLSLDWGAILTTTSFALLGLLGMTVAWLWTVVRLVRGMLRLNDARQVP